jgi:hypothetical protein
LAANVDGSGDASTEPLTQDNTTWNFGTGNNWNKHAKYFAYVNQVGSQGYVCVFPETSYGGTPISIPLGHAASRSAVFGQSNAFQSNKACPKP